MVPVGGRGAESGDEIDLLAYAFDHVRNGLAVIDAGAVVVRVNRAGAAILGRTAEDLVGTDALAIVHPDDLDACLRQLDVAIGTGHGGPLDLRVVHPDGSLVWLRVQATLLPDTRRSIHLMFDDVSYIHELTARFDETTAALHREHEARVSRAKAFADLAALTSGVNDLDALIGGIVDLAVSHIADVAAVALVDEGDGALQVVEVRHRDPEAERVLREAVCGIRVLDPQGAIGAAFERGAPVIDVAGQLHPDPPLELIEFAARNPVDIRHVFPMQSPDGAVGALIIARDLGAEPLTAGDRDLAMVLASRAALAVRNVRLDAQRRAAEAVLERRFAQQAAVAQLGTLAVSGAPVDDLAVRCQKLVETTLGVAHCGVLVDDGHPDGLRLLAVSERLAPHGSGFRYRLAPGLQTVFDTEDAVLVPDVRAETRFSPNQRMIDAGVRSMILAKIESHTAARGVLCAASVELGDFTVEDLAFMQAMANVLASAIDAQSALEHLRHDALHDALTGLPNRVLVLDRLEVALDQASARRTRVAVLACDLDNFKVVNDGFGHAAGDEVLRIAAERLRLQVRPGDTVGRFGGDEFIVVCPDVSDVGAVVTIAERLGRALSHAMPVFGTELVVTVSVGVAFGEGAGPEAAAALLRAADTAMYRAKDRGRDRYEL